MKLPRTSLVLGIALLAWACPSSSSQTLQPARGTDVPPPVRVDISHQGGEGACSPDAAHCLNLLHWGFKVGEKTYPGSEDGLFDMSEAVIGAANAMREDARSKKTYSDERFAVRLASTTPFLCVKEVFVVAAKVQIPYLEIVATHPETKKATTSKVALPFEKSRRTMDSAHPLKISMSWDREKSAVGMLVGGEPVATGSGGAALLQRALRGANDKAAAEKRDAVVIIDVATGVPWEHVAAVIEACRAQEIVRVDFAN